MKKRIGILIALAIAGCGRRTDFLYYLKDKAPNDISKVHKLKELQGENRVDILWVVDNSGSMNSHQQALARNADLFINDFVTKGGLQWKMGLISNTLTQEPFIGFTLPTLLTFQTQDNVVRFKEAVGRLGTGGDVIEKFFTPIQKQLTAFPTFVRKQAILAIIIVTDAAEQSGMPAKKILSYLTKLKGDLKRVIFYGVFSSTDFQCQYTDERWDYVGSPYEEVIHATRGKVYKMCNTDFGKNLSDLGNDLVQRVKRPYIQLEERPYIPSIRVIYKGKELIGGPQEEGGFWLYDFDLNRIVFHSLDFAPGDNEEVTVSYLPD